MCLPWLSIGALSKLYSRLESMLGVHGNALPHLLYTVASLRATVLELFYPGSLAIHGRFESLRGPERYVRPFFYSILTSSVELTNKDLSSYSMHTEVKLYNHSAVDGDEPNDACALRPFNTARENVRTHDDVSIPQGLVAFRACASVVFAAHLYRTEGGPRKGRCDPSWPAPDVNGT